MKKVIFTLTSVAVLVATFALTAAQVSAREPDCPGGVYVSRFKARFGMACTEDAEGNEALGAIAHTIEARSPLRFIPGFIGEFDSGNGVITHLDGYAVDDFSRLEKHHKWTTVRWVHNETGKVHTSRIYIPCRR